MNTRTRIGVVAAASSLALGVALPAQAAAPGLGAAQQLVTARIDGRLSTLHALEFAADSARFITAGDKAALSTLINSDISGLTALRSKVASQTTVAGVRADATSMIDDYRVYLLVAPKVHLTVAFDIEAAAAARLQRVHDALAARVAKQPGGGTAQEKSELADMLAQIHAAQAAISGQVNALLAVAPGPDGPGITAKVKVFQGEARSARGDLKQAVTDAKAVRAALQ